MLVCVASGEPSKDDVLFAGRLARHLGAEITLLMIARTIATPSGPSSLWPSPCARIEVQGIAARSLVRRGAVQDEIMKQMTGGAHDMLVVGAPLSGRDGRSVLAGVVGSTLPAPQPTPS